MRSDCQTIIKYNYYIDLYHYKFFVDYLRFYSFLLFVFLERNQRGPGLEAAVHNPKSVANGKKTTNFTYNIRK